MSHHADCSDGFHYADDDDGGDGGGGDDAYVDQTPKPTTTDHDNAFSVLRHRRHCVNDDASATNNNSLSK